MDTDVFGDLDAKLHLVDSPNGEFWWHSAPLPGRKRVKGASSDPKLQTRVWSALQLNAPGALRGKRVLDIGANDGFFSIAALAAGAATVTSLDKDWSTWPRNIAFLSQAWDLSPEVRTEDFRTFEPQAPYDVILFLGVLYHLEDVFSCMNKLRGLLVEGGELYIETQMSAIRSDLPLFEYASDIYPTIARQDRGTLNMVGISNYLFPNRPAILNLAHSYGFRCETFDGPGNTYTRAFPTRELFRFVKQARAG